MNSFRSLGRLFGSLLIMLLFIGIIAMLSKLFSSHELLFQIIAVVISVLFTAVVTNQLLTGQSNNEESRERNIKIHDKKIRTYAGFMNKLWAVLDDEVITREEIFKIRELLFSNVFFLLNNVELVLIDNAANTFCTDIKNMDPDQLAASKGSMLYRSFANKVASILKNDLKGEDENWKEYAQIVYTGNSIHNLWCRIHKITKPIKNLEEELWNKFNYISERYPSDEKQPQDDQSRISGSLEPIEQSTEQRLNNESDINRPKTLKIRQTWHFCEWSTLQLDKLDNGFNELSLVEYGEYWRTGLVKQVKKGDLVFLFRGAKKYSGAFIAKGWRVFEYDENRNVKEITSDGIPPVLPVGQVNSLKEIAIQEIVKEYDIYESFKDDNSTSCANVVIDERLCYLRDGVENPGGTYRKTISRYFVGYAVKLLEAFKAAKPENAAIIDSRCFEQ